MTTKPWDKFTYHKEFLVENEVGDEIVMIAACNMSGRNFRGNYWDAPESREIDDLTFFDESGTLQMSWDEMVNTFHVTQRDLDELEESFFEIDADANEPDFDEDYLDD